MAPSVTSAQAGLLQRKCACGGEAGLNEKCGGCADRELSARRAGLSSARPLVQDVLRSPGQLLDADSRAFFETRLGHDFSRVKLHTDARAAESARALSARAYTVGRDIVVGSASPALDTRAGRVLLAHELTHVIQQGGRTPGEMESLTLTRPGDASEREADRAAAALSGGGSFRPQTSSGAVVARDMDGGVPPDAGPVDANPIAGVPAPSPAAPTPAPAPPSTPPPPAPPSATITPVIFRGTANRVAPTRTADVTVTINNLPAGNSVTVDVDGSGGVNGSATITAGATLTGSGT
ncbi:MAG: DUF4157 domain-containing protein, partial [Acidobacteriota bacterium]|nr:DUF4157 domain-containing protein [Acidobacteriota bacterium]